MRDGGVDFFFVSLFALEIDDRGETGLADGVALRLGHGGPLELELRLEQLDSGRPAGDIVGGASFHVEIVVERHAYSARPKGYPITKPTSQAP